MGRPWLVVGVPAVLVAAWLVAALVAGHPTSQRRSADSQLPAGALAATPETFRRVFAEARAGDTIVLASGDYGTFRGGMKPGRVVIQAAPRASARMAVELDPAANISLVGLEIRNLEIGGSRTHDIIVRDSRFDRAQAVIRTSELSNANVLFDHNTHVGFVKCDGCYEGRVELTGRTSHSSGVTIRDSFFSGGNSDGIQNGGNGVRILGNMFAGIHQIDGADGVHADAIQLYGSKRTVIEGNRMQDVATGIMAPDGTDHEVIENNEIETAGYPFAITLGGDRGSIVRDNRLDGGACDYGLRCGTLRIAARKDGVGSRGTVVEDNVLGALAVEGGSQLAADRGNVIAG